MEYSNVMRSSSISPNASQEDIEQLDIDIPKLSPHEAAGLESPITKAEIRETISSNEKSPRTPRGVL